MTDDAIADDQIVYWFAGVPVIQDPLPVVLFNFTIDPEKKYATSVPKIIKLAKPYTINFVSVNTTISWYSKKESADRYLIAENQSLIIGIEVSLNGNDWVQAGQTIEHVPSRYMHKLHKEGNTFELKYRTDIILNEDFEAQFIRITVKRRIEEFALAVTDFISNEAWSSVDKALCNLCKSTTKQEIHPKNNVPDGCVYSWEDSSGRYYDCKKGNYIECQQRSPTEPLVDPLIPKEWKENKCIEARLPVSLKSIRAMYLIKGQ